MRDGRSGCFVVQAVVERGSHVDQVVVVGVVRKERKRENGGSRSSSSSRAETHARLQINIFCSAPQTDLLRRKTCFE